MQKKIIDTALKTITAEDHEKYRAITIGVMTHDGAIKSFNAGADGDIMVMGEIIGEGAKLRMMGIIKNGVIESGGEEAAPPTSGAQ